MTEYIVVEVCSDPHGYPVSVTFLNAYWKKERAEEFADKMDWEENREDEYLYTFHVVERDMDGT